MYKFFAQDIHGNLLVYLGAVHWQACLVAGRYFIAGAWRGYDILSYIYMCLGQHLGLSSVYMACRLVDL